MSAATEVTGTLGDVAWLRSTDAIRERARELCDRAFAGRSDVFVARPERLDAVADYVALVSRRDRPRERRAHGRMCHFDAGGRNRTGALEARLAREDAIERARRKIDLVVPSVLLDAGAGDRWRFVDEGTCLTRSEGLAVASLRLFLSGALSGDASAARTDAEGLARVTDEALRSALQVTDANPIVGLEGRASSLRALGAALRDRDDLFGAAARPGHLLDWAIAHSARGAIKATEILSALLEGLSALWPGCATVAGTRLGDVFPHPALGSGARSLVPFHKLSQWLIYSLVEPLSEGGVQVVELDALTGLAEYRNGGLLLDLGALELRDPDVARATHHTASPVVVEWRALTISLLEELAPRLRERLGTPSGGVLGRATIEGCTWAAGRAIAGELRPNAASPLHVQTTGTVF